MYADDTQLYLDFAPEEGAIAVQKINADLDSLYKVSSRHSLSLNPSKSAMMIFGNKNECLNFINRYECKINNTKIEVCNNFRNLGVNLDTQLRFRSHISNCISKAYLNLKLIYPHRAYLGQRSKIVLCNSLVLSHFSFCSALYGPCLDVVTASRIQRVQNSCVRLIYGIRKYEHISHKLVSLNWLNMYNRRLTHTLCLFYKIINNKVPSYLFNKIVYRTDVHNRKLRNIDLLITPPLHKTALFERSYSYNVYSLYNAVPLSVRGCSYNSFKYEVRKLLLYKQIHAG